MNKWRIDFILNSGERVSGIYEGSETTSGDVADRILAGDATEFIGIAALYGRGNLFVRRDQMASATISVYTEV